MFGEFGILVLLVVWLVIVPVAALVIAILGLKRTRRLQSELESVRQRLTEVERERGVVEREVGIAPGATEATASIPREEPPRLPPPLPPGRTSHEQVPVSPAPVEMRSFPMESIGETRLRTEAESTVRPSAEAREAFSLERFLGVKLFAWLGGLAMFFGVVLFLKYAFEHSLLSPTLRVAGGMLGGAMLLAGGVIVHHLPKYRVLAQTFCATGALVLYGVIFAAHSFYHLPAFGILTTFILMSLVTLAAFLVAVRLDALVVAVLGMLGGFLTPGLLSEGITLQGLFGYIALLDLGLLAVSRHSNWRFLKAAAGVGTAVLYLVWHSGSFNAAKYYEGMRILKPMGILLGFLGLFLVADRVGRSRRGVDGFSFAGVLVLAALALGFAFMMLDYEAVAVRLPLLYGFVFLVNVAVMAVVIGRPRDCWAQVVVAAVTFFHLSKWTDIHLSPEFLAPALGAYLAFGALHSIEPLVLMRVRGSSGLEPVGKASMWIMPVVLLLLMPMLERIDAVPMVFWGAVLLANVLAIVLAAVGGHTVPLLLSLAATMALAGSWVLHVPVGNMALPGSFLVVLAGFALLFAGAGSWLARREWTDGTDFRVAMWMPAWAGALPFVLMVMALSRLQVGTPNAVFGVALLMAVLLGGFGVIARAGVLVLVALAGLLAVEGVWHLRNFQDASPWPALAWYCGFHFLLLAYPFVFRRVFVNATLPWVAGALSGVGHFVLVHDVVARSYPNPVMGFVPAAFAVPSLVALAVIVRVFPTMSPVQRNRIAWFGGAALWFITLIFPIQFDRQWLTVAWAVEGALLVLLYRRIMHPGLALVGFGLLVVSFVRLAFDPGVYVDANREAGAFVWQLYVFGAVAASQFAGSFWLGDGAPKGPVWTARRVLSALGCILLFVLLNIGIADAFTDDGARFEAFRFGESFARDMTYSIGWGLFALALLGAGIWRRLSAARYAAVGLLVVTLCKVFLYDLAATGDIFRVGALVGVAVIAFIASFLYQRFLGRSGSS